MTNTPGSDVLVHFDRLAPYIQAALEHAEGTHTLQDVRDKVESGHLQLWPLPTSVVITEVLETPRAKILHFFLCGGNLEELRPVYNIIEEWGKSIGCTRASYIGRHGWQRTFLTREEGWTAPLTYFSKDLTHG